MNDLGFKRLNPQNWLEPDFGPIFWPDPEGAGPGTGWLISILAAPQLSESVPVELVKLLEVAKGAIAYGYFFYPLMTLGNEQLYRVVEAAVAEKFVQLDGPSGIWKFVEKINWLVEQGAITRADQTTWHDIRRLRNKASHPTFQRIQWRDPKRLLPKVTGRR